MHAGCKVFTCSRTGTGPIALYRMHKCGGHSGMAILYLNTLYIDIINTQYTETVDQARLRC